MRSIEVGKKWNPFFHCNLYLGDGTVNAGKDIARRRRCDGAVSTLTRPFNRLNVWDGPPSNCQVWSFGFVFGLALNIGAIFGSQYFLTQHLCNNFIWLL